MPEFRLPDLGEGVTEGELVEWRVKAGDLVAQDQPLAVVATDKATVEIPSPFDGRVEALLVAEGARIQVGEALLRVEGPADAEPSQPPEGVIGPRPQVAAGPAGEATAPPAERVRALPGVRRAARRQGLELERLAASGAQGRVRAQDLDSGGRRVPLRGPARAMAVRVSQAHAHVPQVTVVLEVDLGRVEARVAAFRGAGATGTPTLLGAICRAVLDQLQESPIFNSRLDEEAQELVYHERVHLGVAVQTDSGLLVATIHDADILGEPEFVGRLEEVITKGRAGTLAPRELRGSTFTVSSGGRLGGLLATPLVNWPNVATLGVHAIADRPVVREGRIEVGRVANLSLSFDHRVIDGMAASGFLYRLRDRLEGHEG